MHKNILICVGITILFLGMSITPLGGTLIEYELSDELIIDGPIYGERGQPLEYTLLLTDQGECEIWYYVDWDDGTNTTWLGPYETGEEVIVSHRWYYTGIYTISAVAIGCNDTYYYETLEVTINTPPSPPEIYGPKNGHPDIEYDYTFVVREWEWDMIWLYIDWDDGTFEDWIGPFDGFEEIIVSHSWSENGTYEIRAKAMDYFNESGWATYIVNIGNEPPDMPSIAISGKHGRWYCFIVNSTDPETDNVRYIVDWGDGTTNVTDYYPHCEPVEVCHSYMKGVYLICAKAIDIYGAESDWTTVEVEIPRTRTSSYHWMLSILDRYPLLEVIISRILSL